MIDAFATINFRVGSVLKTRRQLANTISLTVGTSLIIQLVTVASGVILARALGPDGRGTLALAMLWPTLVASMGLFGVSDAVVYRAAAEITRPSITLSNALSLAIVQSLLLSAVGWYVIPIVLHGKPSLTANAEFYLWYIPISLFALYAIAFLQGRMAMWSFNLLRASVHVFYTVLLALFWLTHYVDVESALALSLLSNAITLALCATTIVRGGFVGLRIDPNELRSLISLGLKLNLGNLAFILASRIDMIALSFLVPARVLGDYVVAMAVGALPLIVPSAVSLVLYPRFSQQPRAKAGRMFARFMLVAISMTAAGAPVVLLISPLVVKVVFGSAFSAAATIGQILGLASLLRGMSVMTTSVLRGLGAPIRASGGDVAGLLVMGVLLVPAIHLAGGAGAAVAVLLGTVTTASWMTYHAMRVVKMSPGQLIRWWEIDFGVSHAGPTV